MSIFIQEVIKLVIKCLCLVVGPEAQRSVVSKNVLGRFIQLFLCTKYHLNFHEKCIESDLLVKIQKLLEAAVMLTCSTSFYNFPFFIPVSCSLPEQQADLLEELLYVDLQQEEAQMLLQEYKDEARRLLPPVPKQEKKPRLYKKRPHPHGPLPSHRHQWAYSKGQREKQWWIMFYVINFF